MTQLTNTHTILGKYAEDNAMLQIELVKAHARIKELEKKISKTDQNSDTPVSMRRDEHPEPAEG